MSEVSGERLRTLALFIRSQAHLTDKHPPAAGPGSVTLNYEEALLAADGLDAEVRYREGRERAESSMDNLLTWAMEQWMDASEAVAMGGGTGSRAHEVLAASPALQRMCATVDRWEALCAVLRGVIEREG